MVGRRERQLYTSVLAFAFMPPLLSRVGDEMIE
jgi:hypothetical protein